MRCGRHLGTSSSAAHLARSKAVELIWRTSRFGCRDDDPLGVGENLAEHADNRLCRTQSRSASLFLTSRKQGATVYKPPSKKWAVYNRRRIKRAVWKAPPPWHRWEKL